MLGRNSTLCGAVCLLVAHVVAAAPPSFHRAATESLLSDELLVVSSTSLALLDQLIDNNLGMFPAQSDTAELRAALGRASVDALGVDLLLARRVVLSVAFERSPVLCLEGDFVGELKGEAIASDTPERMVQLFTGHAAALVASPYAKTVGGQPGGRLLVIGATKRVAAKLDVFAGRSANVLSGPRVDALVAHMAQVQEATLNLTGVLAGAMGPDVSAPPADVGGWAGPGALSAATVSLSPGRPTQLVVSGAKFLLDYIAAQITAGRTRTEQVGAASLKHFEGLDDWMVMLPALVSLKVPAAMNTLKVKRLAPTTLGFEAPSLAALGLTTGTFHSASLTDVPSCEATLAHVVGLVQADRSMPADAQASLLAALQSGRAEMLAECESGPRSHRSCVSQCKTLAELDECGNVENAQTERKDEANLPLSSWALGAIADRLLRYLSGEAWPDLGLADVGDSLRALLSRTPRQPLVAASFDLGGLLRAWNDRNLGLWTTAPKLAARERKLLGQFTRGVLGVDLMAAKALHVLVSRDDDGWALTFLVDGSFKAVEGAKTEAAGPFPRRPYRSVLGGHAFATTEGGQVIVGNKAGVLFGLAISSARSGQANLGDGPLAAMTRQVPDAPFLAVTTGTGFDAALALGGERAFSVWAQLDDSAQLHELTAAAEAGRGQFVKLIAGLTGGLGGPGVLSDLILAKVTDLMGSFSVQVVDSSLRLEAAQWAGSVATVLAFAGEDFVKGLLTGFASTSQETDPGKGDQEAPAETNHGDAATETEGEGTPAQETNTGQEDDRGNTSETGSGSRPDRSAE